MIRKSDVKKGGGRTVMNECDGPGDFWAHVSKPCPKEVSGSSNTGDRSFTGVDNYGEALALARNGWPEGLERIKKMAGRISRHLASAVMEQAMVYDVVGESPDVGAFLSGEPEHMMRFEEAEGAPKVIRVTVNICASGGIGKEVLMRRGAVACALVDCIERAGFRAEVIATFGSKANGNAWFFTMPAKRPEEPLNMDRMAFILAHPAFLRRLIFRAMELEAKPSDFNVPCGYGTPCDPPKEYQGEVYLPAMSSVEACWRTEEAAEVEALRILRKIGVVAELEASK